VRARTLSPSRDGTVKRLLLVRHAATSATRAAAFPADEPIEAGAEDVAAGVAGLVRRGRSAAASVASGAGASPVDAAAAAPGAPALSADGPGVEVLASPALRCAQTAAAAGLVPRVDPLLAECDFGAWGGRSLAELHAENPAAVGAWMGDPDAAPHGGESLRAFAARVAGWLDGQADGEGTTLAITHGGVVKAALVHALGAPLDAFWRLDVAPLAVTELHAHDGRWTITRMNCPLELAGRHPNLVGAAT
jgi:broad specificity phosphatase PhoE